MAVKYRGAEFDIGDALKIGGAVLIGVYLLSRNAGAVAQGVASTAVESAGGLVTGAVIGAGSVVGVPQTDAQKCADAKAAGNSWDASFYCPASEFIAWEWNK